MPARPTPWLASKAASRGAAGIKDSQLLEMFAEQCGRCAYCLATMTDYHVEHVIPTIRGGARTIDNVVLTCIACNKRKGPKTILEFLASQ